MNAVTAVAADQGNGEIADFLARLSDPAIDAAKAQMLWSIYEKWLAEKRKAAFNGAMSAIQQELAEKGLHVIEPVRLANIPNGPSYKFAANEDVVGPTLPIVAKHGISISFPVVKTADGNILMSCRLRHLAGYMEEITGPDAPPDDRGPKGNVTKTQVQGNQSTMTYQQRGLYCRAFCIVVAKEDNDGAHGRRAAPADRPRSSDLRQYAEQLQDAPSEAEAPQSEAEAPQVDAAHDWANRVALEFANALSEAEVTAVRRSIGRNYAKARIARPELAAMIDEAELQAIERVDAAKQGGEVAPGMEIAGEANLQA